MAAQSFIKHLTMKHRSQSGFTLIELMAVIAIVAVLAVWGVPSYASYMASKRVDSAATQIAASIKLARSQAMTTGREINLCGLNDARTGCSGTPENWSVAWGIVANGSGGATQVLQVYEAPQKLQINASNIVIGANGMRSGGGQVVILVLPEGGGSGKTVTISAASLSYKVENV